MRKLICKLPELRARHGRLSIQEVSRRTGIAASTLSKIETGKTKGIDFETIEKLCDFFQAGLGDMFELVEPDQVPQSFDDLAALPAA